MSARIGGIIAPQIVLLVSMWEVEIKIVLVLQKILKIQMLTRFKGNADYTARINVLFIETVYIMSIDRKYVYYG